MFNNQQFCLLKDTDIRKPT